MVYQIPKKLKEEYKILDHPFNIWWKDIVTFAVMMGIFLIFKSFVHSWFVIPYWATAVISSYFLIQPSSSNPKKRNWEAIILMVDKDRLTHYSINHMQGKEAYK